MRRIWFDFAKRCCLNGLLWADSIAPFPGIAILEYHRVSPNIGPHDVHSIYPEEFEWQLNWLKENSYRIVGLDEILTSQDHPRGERCVALTFDDGHRDILQYAAPILRRHGARATVFVLSDYVGCAGWLQADGVLAESTFGVQQWSLLTWEELRSGADVFEIGVHGKTHVPLTMLPDARILCELKEARHVIARELGVMPKFYCYPYGLANDRIISAIESLGFSGACGVARGLNRPEHNRFCLRRNEVGRGLNERQFALLTTEYIRLYSALGRMVRM